MLTQRIGRSVARLVTSKNVSLQTRRTLYPHYLRYIAFNVPGKAPVSFGEKVGVYLAFMVGILGPPTFIMYDVGKKRKALGQ